MELPKSVSKFLRFLPFLPATGLPAWGTAFGEIPDIYSASSRAVSLKTNLSIFLYKGLILIFLLYLNLWDNALLVNFIKG